MGRIPEISCMLMLPAPLAVKNYVAAGFPLRVGRLRADAGAHDTFWPVGEPYGPGKIVLIASETALYQGLREQGEMIKDYMAFLPQALDAATKRARVGVVAAEMTTQASE